MNMIIDQAMPFWDDQVGQCWVINETEDWVICVVPQIFNDRICIADKTEYGRTWTAGWCYERAPGGAIAGSFASVWDPTQDWRPLGFKKIAFDMRDDSHLDLDQWQYVCQWCQSEVGIKRFDAHDEHDQTICAQCGALRTNGAWFEGLGERLRFPTGRMSDAGPTDLLSV